MSMGSHHSAAMVSDTYLTPREIIEACGPFDLDPCAAPLPRPWSTAQRHIVLPNDGLAEDWGNAFVWLNPPYSREARAWLMKLSQHPGGGIALIFARTETEWFVDSVWHAERATAILFLHGRNHIPRPSWQPGQSARQEVRENGARPIPGRHRVSSLMAGLPLPD